MRSRAANSAFRQTLLTRCGVDSVAIKVATRGSQILNLKFALGRTTGTMYRLKEAPGATPEQLAVREGWLDGRTAR